MGTITLRAVVGGAVAMICSTAGQRHGPRIKVKKGRERKKEVGRNGALALACNALTTRLQRPRFPMELRSGEEETGPRDGGNAVTVAVVWEIEKGKGEGERVRRLLPPVVGGLLSLSRPRPEPPRSTRRGCANRLANQGAGPFYRSSGAGATVHWLYCFNPDLGGGFVWLRSLLGPKALMGDAARRGISAGGFFSSGQMAANITPRRY